MKLLSVIALTAALTVVPTIHATPTEDCKKTAEELRLDSQLSVKFSSLHSKASDAPATRWGHGNGYGNDNYGQGAGGFHQARHILERAVRDSQYGSSFNAADDLDRAIRSARRECVGTADKFAGMLDVLTKASRNIFNFNDKLVVLRGGINFLIQNGPTTASRDILLLGLSMTAPSMSNYSVASGVFDVILPQARIEARNENKKEWQSLLSFAAKGANSTFHFQSKYALQSRIARAICDARPGQAVFLKTLSLVAAMKMVNSLDQAHIIVLGLKEYARTVPFENHREVANYLVAAGSTIYNAPSKVSMYRGVMPNLVGLDTNTPAARVVIRAGIQLSGCKALSAMDAWGVGELAATRALRLQLPSFVQETLRFGLSEARSEYNMNRRLRIIRDALQRASR